MSSSSSFTPRRSARLANKPKISYKEESWSYADAFRTPEDKRTPIQKMLIDECMMNIKKAQESTISFFLKEQREFDRILAASMKHTPPPSPPPFEPSTPPSASDILMEAIRRMNEEHPEENFSKSLYPMTYGIEYDGYDEEEYTDLVWDEEELTEEEVDKLMKLNGY
jgi:hypothetical protein